jgi:hypothetical protein
VRVSVLLVAAALIPASAPANCEADPAAAARQFWEGHSRFFAKEDPELSAVTTPRFYSALQHEWKCLAKHSASCPGYRPWPHPDDKRFGAYPTFYIPVSRPDLWSITKPEHVLVTMAYALIDADGRSGPDQFVVVTLVRAPDERCWLVDDVVTPDHGSLRVRFRGPDS